MATRPAWTIQDNKVVRRDFEFTWNGGFAMVQKQKNVVNLHNSIQNVTGETALEISQASLVNLGKNLSAFNLKYNGVYVENIFQSSKKFEYGGNYADLLEVSPRQAKLDERLQTSGRLVSFEFNGEEWSLEPKTHFYDYIYIKALIENYGYDLDLDKYVWFTDIFLNPKKSINCQARAVAIYKLLKTLDMFNSLDSKESWLNFHKTYVMG